MPVPEPTATVAVPQPGVPAAAPAGAAPAAGGELTGPSVEALVSTRTVLHAVAELVLAGPQHRSHGTIRLEVAAGAVQTVAGPPLRLEAARLIGPGGQASLLGTTSALALGAAVGVTAGAPDGVYERTGGVELDEPLSVDTDLATALLDFFAVGQAALALHAPDERPVLWPEHFDLAVTVDGVGYGVSPGDAYSAQPYAYVGPGEEVADPFFDAPFGALRTWAQVPDSASVAAFFADGRDRLVAARGATPPPR